MDLNSFESGMIDINTRELFINSEVYKTLSNYAELFYEENKSELEIYNKKWDCLPIYQWSRQIEYPYFYEAITKLLKDKSNAKCLDAGSGVTFFPYFLEKKLPNVEFHCLDFDPSQNKLHAQIANKSGSGIKFTTGDMRKMSYESNSFDLIYSVSVLEHIPDYHLAIKEMMRVLKPGGHLVLSFDISLDNRRQIDVEGFKQLREQLNQNFTPILPESNTQQPLTTLSVFKLTKDKRLLPWRELWKNCLKELSQFRSPVAIYNLGLFCQIYRKES